MTRYIYGFCILLGCVKMSLCTSWLPPTSMAPEAESSNELAQVTGPGLSEPSYPPFVDGKGQRYCHDSFGFYHPPGKVETGTCSITCFCPPVGGAVKCFTIECPKIPGCLEYESVSEKVCCPPCKRHSYCQQTDGRTLQLGDTFTIDNQCAECSCKKNGISCRKKHDCEPTMCNVDFKEYPLGAILPTIHKCYTCVCEKGGRMECEKMKCPELNCEKQYVTENECCPKCR